MSGTLGADAAWELVRAVAAAPDASRVSLDQRPDVWLEVGTRGNWTTSADVSDAARDVLEIYLPLVAVSRVVIGQLGQSLDGRIATVDGDSHYVTGPEDRERLHRLRALVDAVVVGASTVDADDPQLTVRHVAGANPVRVVLDPSSRCNDDARVFTDGVAPTLRICCGHQQSATSGAQTHDLDEMEPDAPETLHVPCDEDGLDLWALLGTLRARGLHRILVEGGGTTVSRFLEAGLLDRLHVSVAPLLIGSGRSSITLNPVESLSDALRPPARRYLLGEDVLFDLDLRAGPR